MNERDSGERPPGALRVAWLVSALALRRMSNRFASRWRRRGASSTRSGTARKGAPGRILVVFFSLLFFLNGVNVSTQIVRQIASNAELRNAGDYVLVSENVLEWVVAADLLERESEAGRTEWRTNLTAAFRRAALDEGIHDEEGQDVRAGELTLLFERRGSDAFRKSDIPHDGILPSPRVWYHGGAPFDMLGPLALVACLLTVAVTLFGIFGPERELAKVEWSLEWWFTFPVSARGLVLARLLETAVGSPLVWFMILPFFSVIYYCAGCSHWAVPLGFLTAVYYGVLAGSLRIALETTLRRYVPLALIASLQSAVLLVAYPLLMAAFAAIAPAWLAILVRRSVSLPSWFFFNPFSLPLCALLPEHVGRWAVVGAPLFAAFALVASVAWAERMVKDGLTTSLGSPTTSRGSLPRDARSPFGFAIPAVARKELIALTRDRNLMMQALVVPVVLVGFQLFLNPSIFRAGTVSSHHAAAIVFAFGAFVLASGACNGLATEAGSLWILYTIPRGLDRVLADKAAFWAAVALSYAVLALALFGSEGASASVVFSAPVGIALAGLIIYAFIASAIGALGTDPLESEPRRRIQVSMVYLYLLLASLFGYALYAPSSWAKFAQTVLSTLLAFALWQKMRDHAPYLLDPTEAPPPRIAVADGVIAALAFFVLQGLLVLLAVRVGVSPGASLLVAFVGAGSLVALLSVFVFWRIGVPDLGTTLGFRAPGASVPGAAAIGVAAGLGAAALAAGYLAVVARVPWLRAIRDEALHVSANERSADLLRFVLVLAVFAAPVFEELIFRGILFRGFRRSVGPVRAALASAAVFALCHPAIAFVPVFALAVFAALSYERSRLLLTPILAHMTYNALVFGFSLHSW